MVRHLASPTTDTACYAIVELVLGGNLGLQPTTASRASPLRPQFPSCSLQPHTRPCSRHTPNGETYSHIYSHIHFKDNNHGPWRQIERARMSAVRIPPPSHDSPPWRPHTSLRQLCTTPPGVRRGRRGAGSGRCGEGGPRRDPAGGGVSVEGAPCAPGSWVAPTPGLATVV